MNAAQIQARIIRETKHTAAALRQASLDSPCEACRKRFMHWAALLDKRALLMQDLDRPASHRFTYTCGHDVILPVEPGDEAVDSAVALPCEACGGPAVSPDGMSLAELAAATNRIWRTVASEEGKGADEEEDSIG